MGENRGLVEFLMSFGGKRMSRPVFEDLFNYREGHRNRKSLIMLMAAQTAMFLFLMKVIVLVVPNPGDIGQRPLHNNWIPLCLRICQCFLEICGGL